MTGYFVDAKGRVELHTPDVPLLVTIGAEGYKEAQIEAEPDTEIEVTLEPQEAE